MLIVVSAKYKYEPDYAVSPGSLLQERLDLLGMSVSDLAVQIGSPAEYLRELVAGEAALHREVAVALERQFGLAADIWLGIDSKYHERRTIEWAKKFPIKDLIKRGAIEKPTADTDLVTKLLDFLVRRHLKHGKSNTGEHWWLIATRPVSRVTNSLWLLGCV